MSKSSPIRRPAVSWSRSPWSSLPTPLAHQRACRPPRPGSAGRRAARCSRRRSGRGHRRGPVSDGLAKSSSRTPLAKIDLLHVELGDRLARDDRAGRAERGQLARSRPRACALRLPGEPDDVGLSAPRRASRRRRGSGVRVLTSARVASPSKIRLVEASTRRGREHALRRARPSGCRTDVCRRGRPSRGCRAPRPCRRPASRPPRPARSRPRCA